jgi:hypothetical protein
LQTNLVTLANMGCTETDQLEKKLHIPGLVLMGRRIFFSRARMPVALVASAAFEMTLMI